VRRLGLVAISQALRPSSKWLPGSVKLTMDHSRTPPGFDQQLQRWLRRIANDCQLEKARAQAGIEAHIIKGDAVNLPLRPGLFDAVVTSPPYFVTYDYFEVNRLSYIAFEWDQPRSTQVGIRYGVSPDGVGFQAPESLRHWYEDRYRGESTVFGRALRLYVQRMRTAISEVHRVMCRGGVIAISIADSRRQEQLFPLVEAIAELLEEEGFTDISRADRLIGETRILPAMRNAKSGRFAAEGILGAEEKLLFARR
jgi:hypothetical protein